jgi:hypothetical protein
MPQGYWRIFAAAQRINPYLLSSKQLQNYRHDIDQKNRKDNDVFWE